MAIKLSITELKELGMGIWEAQLDPIDLRMLAPTARSNPGPSVLLLAGEAGVAPGGGLEASLSSVRVLNVGTTGRLIVVRGDDRSDGMGAVGDVADDRPNRGSAFGATVSRMAGRSGDIEFVNATPAHLRPLAEGLLGGVRRHYAGELVFKPRSRRFVETPDNWWTVKPQPVAKSFRFTVRATVRQLEDLGLPNLVRDRNDSYAGFTMDSEGQLQTVLAALRRAAQNRRL